MAENDTDVFDEVETKEEVKEAEAKETETKEDTEKGATEDKSETEDGEEKSEKEESPSSKDDSDEEAGQLATIKAERQRRQDAVAESDDLRKQLRRIQESQQEVPDAATDPDGFELFQDNKLFATKLDMAEEMIGEDDKPQYREDKAVFTNLVSEVVDGKSIQKDETLYKNFRKSGNPAQFIRDTVTKHNKALEVSADDYETKQEAKYRAKFIAEQKEKGVDTLPDLTNAAASESNTEDQDKDPGDHIDAFDD